MTTDADTRASGSTVGVDLPCVVGVYVEPTRVGWCIRVGAEVLVAGGWESAEAAVVKAAAAQAAIVKAADSLSGRAPSKPGGHPGRAWPLPTTSTAVLLSAIEAAMAEHAETARAWWQEHDVTVAGDESPWLVSVSDVHVPTNHPRVAALRALQSHGSAAYILGAITGHWPACIVIAVPDAGDRHLPKHGGTGKLADYWPKALRGIAAKARAEFGRHAFTVGGDAATAYVDTYGLTLPCRTLTGPTVMPARGNVPAGDVDTDVYTPAPRAAKPAVGQSKPAAPVPGDARTYLAALHRAVTATLAAGAGTTYLADVLRACAIAVTTIPAPDGVDQLGADELAVVLITRAKVAPHLNTGEDALRVAIQSLAG